MRDGRVLRLRHRSRVPHPARRDCLVPRRPSADAAFRTAFLRVPLPARNHPVNRQLDIPPEDESAARLHAPARDEGAADRPLDCSCSRRRVDCDGFWRGRLVLDAVFHLREDVDHVLARCRRLCGRRGARGGREGPRLVQLGLPCRNSFQPSLQEKRLRPQDRQGLCELQGVFWEWGKVGG